MKIRHDRVSGGLLRPHLFLNLSWIKLELLKGEVAGERVVVDEEIGESGDIDDADDEQEDDDDSLMS